MGTNFKICVYAHAGFDREAHTDLANSFRQLDEIDGWMSDWRPETELSRVNSQAGVKPVPVRTELFRILSVALQISRVTEGAFDPTFNAFWGLYNFKPGHQRMPSDAEILATLPLIDYRQVQMDAKHRTVFLRRRGMKLGLGGIGQGYGVEQIIQDLKKKYSAGYADGSGDTYFWGKKPSGELWTTGVRNPHDKANVILRIYATDVAITTCGDDEKFFFRNGLRIHHIIDPKTGYPARRSRQTTIISSSATLADGYDTATFVMGPERAKPLIEQLGMEGIFVDDRSVTLTKGLVRVETAWGPVYMLKRQM